MIVKSFRLKDLKEYEDTEHKSILDFIFTPSFYGTRALVHLGNECCGFNIAGDIISEYLKSHTFWDIHKEIRKLLLGEKSVDTEASEEDTIDISEYKSLTELYNSFYTQVFNTSGILSYTDFWSLTTVDMYRLFDIINIQKVNEFNDYCYKSWISAGLNGSSTWGKLPKQPPQIKGELTKEEKERIKKKNKVKYDEILKSNNPGHATAILNRREALLEWLRQ